MKMLVRLKMSTDLSEFVLLLPDTLRRMGTLFIGHKTAIINFASLFDVDQLLKERICSSRRKFFPLRADLYIKIFYFI